LGQNESVKLALALSHIVPNVVDQTFEGSAWFCGRKAKPGRPSISKGGPRHQNHAKMNIYILENAMAVQRRNDQKVVTHVRAKA
jgi:hypothetical protein